MLVVAVCTVWTYIWLWRHFICRHSLPSSPLPGDLWPPGIQWCSSSVVHPDHRWKRPTAAPLDPPSSHQAGGYRSQWNTDPGDPGVLAAESLEEKLQKNRSPYSEELFKLRVWTLNWIKPRRAHDIWPLTLANAPSHIISDISIPTSSPQSVLIL